MSLHRIATVAALALAFPFVLMGLGRALYLALREWSVALGFVVAEGPVTNMQAFSAGVLAVLLTGGAFGVIAFRVFSK